MCAAAAGESEGPLLLHVDSTTKKLALKTLESGAAASSSGAKGQGRRTARPADLKLAPCLSSLVQISCRYGWGWLMGTLAGEGVKGKGLGADKS